MTTSSMADVPAELQTSRLAAERAGIISSCSKPMEERTGRHGPCVLVACASAWRRVRWRRAVSVAASVSLHRLWQHREPCPALEVLNKAHGTYALFLEAMAEAAGSEADFRRVATTSVRGRDAPVDVVRTTWPRSSGLVRSDESCRMTQAPWRPSWVRWSLGTRTSWALGFMRVRRHAREHRFIAYSLLLVGRRNGLPRDPLPRFGRSSTRSPSRSSRSRWRCSFGDAKGSLVHRTFAAPGPAQVAMGWTNLRRRTTGFPSSS